MIEADADGEPEVDSDSAGVGEVDTMMESVAEGAGISLDDATSDAPEAGETVGSGEVWTERPTTGSAGVAEAETAEEWESVALGEADALGSLLAGAVA